MDDQALYAAINVVLSRGLSVANAAVDTWVVKENGHATMPAIFAVDGYGNEPIEEDFTDSSEAIKYFLQIQDR